MPSPPAIDYLFFPHIVDQIIDYSPRDALLALRLVSRKVHDRVDRNLGTHIVIQDAADTDASKTDADTSTSPVGVEITLASGRRTALAQRYATDAGPLAWSALEGTRVLDLSGSQWLEADPFAFPFLLSALNRVDTIRILPGTRVVDSLDAARYVLHPDVDLHALSLRPRRDVAKVVIHVRAETIPGRKDVDHGHVFGHLLCALQGARHVVIVFGSPKDGGDGAQSDGDTPDDEGQVLEEEEDDNDEDDSSQYGSDYTPPPPLRGLLRDIKWALCGRKRRLTLVDAAHVPLEYFGFNIEDGSDAASTHDAACAEDRANTDVDEDKGANKITESNEDKCTHTDTPTHSTPGPDAYEVPLKQLLIAGLAGQFPFKHYEARFLDETIELVTLETYRSRLAPYDFELETVFG